MFSGIIAGTFRVNRAILNESGMALAVSLDSRLLSGLEKGASVAVNGVCLTVVSMELQTAENQGVVCFDVVPETLKRSNLGDLREGSTVNIERSLRFGDEVGGHLCSGHVDSMAEVAGVDKIGEGAEIEFIVEDKFRKFILEKGYVALNGASLTIAKKTESGFVVAFIPETLRNTNLGMLQADDKVNLEIDRSTQAIVDTVERLMAQQDALIRS